MQITSQRFPLTGLLFSVFGLVAISLHAEPSEIENVPFLPINCSELIPDHSPFVGFFGSVARGAVASNATLSKKILQILAMRDEVEKKGTFGDQANPIDFLIRKTLCFYREQIEPLKSVPYDDPELVKFLQGALGELQQKVDAAIFQVEYERARRVLYEKQLEKNQRVIEKLEIDAQKKANQSYNRIESRAMKEAAKP